MQRLLKHSILVAIVLLGSLLQRPFELAHAQEEPTFRAQSNVVLVPVLVRYKASQVVLWVGG